MVNPGRPLKDGRSIWAYRGGKSWLTKGLSKDRPKQKNKGRKNNEKTKFLKLEARKGRQIRTTKEI